MKFKKGDKVHLTKYGKSQFPDMTTTGIVACKQRTDVFVTVLVDGKKQRTIYHVVFWDHKPTQAGRE